jgi:hypothetical protein
MRPHYISSGEQSYWKKNETYQISELEFAEKCSHNVVDQKSALSECAEPWPGSIHHEIISELLYHFKISNEKQEAQKINVTVDDKVPV